MNSPAIFLAESRARAPACTYGGLLRALLLLAVLLFPGRPASAQSAPPPLARLEVGFWPEYDRSAVLVIYRVTLSPAVSLPAQLSLPIPADVGEPSAVASGAPDGSLVNAEYTRQVQGEVAIITVQADSARVWVEYYDAFERQGQTRSYMFSWAGGVEAEALAYDIQQPVGAGAFEIQPPPDGQRTGADGLTYYSADLGPLNGPAPSLISFSYTRATDELTIDLLPEGPTLGRPEATQGGAPDLARVLPWAIAGVLALVIVGAGFVYLRGRAEPAASKRRRRAARRTEAETAAVFCHNCGTPAGAADRFCRNCGTPLRR